MKYQVKIEKTVVKFLQKHSTIAPIFLAKVEILQEQWIHHHNKKWTEQLDIKRLKNTKDRRRLRIGKYRFLFRQDNESIIIYCYDADSRGDIYKRL